MSLITVAVLVISCQNKDNSSIRTIDVLLPGGPEIKNLSEIAIDIQYIPPQRIQGLPLMHISYFWTRAHFIVNSFIDMGQLFIVSGYYFVVIQYYF
jgi:hypothetical protein